MDSVRSRAEHSNKWLLIKRARTVTKVDDRPVISGQAARYCGKMTRGGASRSGLPNGHPGHLIVKGFEPMQRKAVTAPAEDSTFEIKFDGYRAAVKSGPKVTLSATNVDDAFQSLKRSARRRFVIDGKPH
jgi:ATP-dependent DNA ligase